MADEQAPITILIVEDDHMLQELYLERFSEAGLNVLQAFDGMEALQMVNEHPEIQLVLLDIMLPKVSGYDVLVQIRHNPDRKMLPVIVVSALSDIDDQARGLQLGANDYITKGEMLPASIIEKIQKYALSVSGATQE